MCSYRIILASSSPRRQEILKSLGLSFETMASDIDETLADEVTPEDAVMMLSRRKAEVVSKFHETGLVIGSDTLIAFEGKKLGKPQVPERAVVMLQALRGKTHHVLTGLTVIDSASGRSETRLTVTDVKMRDYSDSEITSYVATGEPMDKAGSYAIQGLGASLVEQIHGAMDNVIGLPSSTLIEMLGDFGVVVRRFPGADEVSD